MERDREWAMFVVNILAFVFTFYSLVRTARYHGKVLFELLPLSINTVATLVLLFVKLFEKGYEFDLVGYAIEIFTYFLFCYTFSVMHARLIAKHRLQISKYACAHSEPATSSSSSSPSLLLCSSSSSWRR